jgi:predicted nucleotidyltransferase
MATALELGPEGWKPYIEALRKRPEPILSPDEIMERERLIEKAKEAAAMLKERYGATRVILFGSLAHKEWFHERTDVDLAVEGLRDEVFYRAWGEADEMIPGRRMDIVGIASAKPSIREAIQRHGVEL